MGEMMGGGEGQGWRNGRRKDRRVGAGVDKAGQQTLKTTSGTRDVRKEKRRLADHREGGPWRRTCGALRTVTQLSQKPAGNQQQWTDYTGNRFLGGQTAL